MVLMMTVLATFLMFLSYSFFLPKKSKSKMCMSLLKYSGGVGVMCIFYWMILDCPSFLFSMVWFNSHLQEFTLSFIVDYYFVMFGGVALFVTWSIIEFSHYYMTSDPHKQSFFNTLMLFLFFMLLLVCSKSLFLLFVGWEGVGMLSFILMGWWFTRSEASSSALQAIIYNRLGDTGMILFMIFSMIKLDSWSLKDMLFFNKSKPLSNWAMMGMMMAATGKSAQFSLHPWLPSAMEGPTPVSALLHSSTMVVAGVFLLIRTFPLLETSSWAPTVISLLGSLTALFAASVALFQYDMKKVVAYSTTSQLGLMVVAVGLGLPWLALFHMCTHAFFKALLFLCSGSVIHSLKKEQDLRKMGASTSVLPFTSSAMVIGSLALCGIPFLAGYYSKDLILEAAQYNLTNSLSMVFSMVATLMTAVYSARIVYYLSGAKKTTYPSNPISEENFNLTLPLLRLLVGAFAAGWMFSLTAFHSLPLVIPLINKSLPLLLTMFAMIYLFFLSSPQESTATIKSSTFLASNWFFVQLSHGSLLMASARSSIRGVLRSLDHGWTAYLGPSGMPTPTNTWARLLQKAQTGNLTNYMLYFILLLAVSLVFSSIT